MANKKRRKPVLEQILEGVKDRKNKFGVYRSLHSNYSKQVWCFQDFGNLTLFPNCIINEAMFFRTNDFDKNLIDKMKFDLEDCNINYILNSYRAFLIGVKDFVFQEEELSEYRNLYIESKTNSYKANKRYPDELFQKLKSGMFTYPTRVRLAIEKFEKAFLPDGDQNFLKDYKQIVEECPIATIKDFFIELPNDLDKLDLPEKPDDWFEFICETLDDNVYEYYWKHLDSVLSEEGLLYNSDGEIIAKFESWDLFRLVMGFDTDGFRKQGEKCGLGTTYHSDGFIFIDEIESAREVSQDEWFRISEDERYERSISATEDQFEQIFLVVSSPYLEYVNLFDYFATATYITGMDKCIVSYTPSGAYSYVTEEDNINCLLSLSRLFADLNRIESCFHDERENNYANSLKG